MFGHGIGLWQAASASGKSHPWDGLMANVWVGDSQYVDASSVGTWTAQAGAVNLTATVKPTQKNSAFVNSTTKSGIIGSTAGAVYMTGDALAASMGNAFTAIWSFRCDTVGAAVSYWFGFGNSTTIANLLVFMDASGHINVARRSTGSQFTLTTTQSVMSGNRYVTTLLFDGANATVRINGAATSINGTAWGGGATTLDRFTLFSNRTSGGPVGGYGGHTYRFLGFAPGVVLASGDYTAIENYLMSEATASPIYLLGTGATGSAVRDWQSDSGVHDVGAGVCDSWTDTVSSAAAAQGTALNRPTIVSSNVVSPRISFNGSQYLEDDTCAASFQGAFTSIMHFVCPALGSGMFLWAAANSGNTTDYVHFILGSTGTLTLGRSSSGGGLSSVSTTQVLTPGTKYVLTALYNGATATIRINGVTSSVNGTAIGGGTPSLNNFLLGAKKTSSGIVTPDFTGTLEAFLGWSSALVSGDYTPVENLLIANW